MRLAKACRSRIEGTNKHISQEQGRLEENSSGTKCRKIHAPLTLSTASSVRATGAAAAAAAGGAVPSAGLEPAAGDREDTAVTISVQQGVDGAFEGCWCYLLGPPLPFP